MMHYRFLPFLIALACTQWSRAFTVSPLSRTSLTSSATAIKYAATAPPPTASFEERMRDMVHGKSSRKQKRRTAPPKNIEQAATLDEYKSVVADETEKMVVVRFHAPWCRACKAATPAYLRLASEFASNDIKFVDCPVTASNGELHRGLGIKTIPFAHIYHPETGLVEERKIGRKHFSKFEKVLSSYVEGKCDVLDDECSNPYPTETNTRS